MKSLRSSWGGTGEEGWNAAVPDAAVYRDLEAVVRPSLLHAEI